MTKPQITSQISLGNIIQIALILAGLTGAWFTMGHRTEVTAAGMAKNASQIVENERRIRALETSQARSEERNNSVLQILGRIEARLERIEQSR